MKSLLCIGIISLIFGVFSCEGEDKKTAETDTTAPTVVSVNPANGATGVDKTITKITVTFNEDMSGGYSVGGSVVPVGFYALPVDGTEDPQWIDSKTIEIYVVALSASTAYGLVLNHGEYNNFKDTSGNSLESYLLTFTTGL